MFSRISGIINANGVISMSSRSSSGLAINEDACSSFQTEMTPVRRSSKFVTIMWSWHLKILNYVSIYVGGGPMEGSKCSEPMFELQQAWIAIRTLMAKSLSLTHLFFMSQEWQNRLRLGWGEKDE